MSPSVSQLPRPDEALAHVIRECRLRNDKYVAVPVRNVQYAMETVADSFPLDSQSMLLTCLAQTPGGSDRLHRLTRGKHLVAPQDWLDLRLPGSQLSSQLRKSKAGSRHLFAFPLVPGQGSSSSSLQYPLRWISEARNSGWKVLLDMSAILLGREAAPDLSMHCADFIVCRFVDPGSYTTRCCLICRR